MYHIKNDIRSQKSAKLICEGLSEKLSHFEYNEINITSVCNSCGVSRATFYRLFDNLDDILIFQFDSLFNESIQKLLKEHNKKNISLVKTLIELAINNKPLIINIIKSGRTDIFSFSSRNKENTIIQNLDIDTNTLNTLYCTPMLDQMAFSVINTWYKNGCIENAEQLYNIMKNAIKIIYDNI